MSPAPTVHFGHNLNEVTWIYDRRNGGWGADLEQRGMTEPAPTLTAQGLAKGRDVWMAKKEDRAERKAQGAGNRPRHADAPAATIDTRADLAEWVHEQPAPTIVTTRRSKDGILVGRQLPEGEGENVGGWGWERPSTTVNADPRISEPGHHDENKSGSQQKNAVRVTVREAAILQSFPPDFPWQGSRTAQFRQIGNAVPPKLAKAILGSLLEARKAVP